MPMLWSELDLMCEGELNLMGGVGYTAATPDFSSMAKPFSLDTLDDMFSASDWDYPMKHEWDDMSDEMVASEGDSRRQSDGRHNLLHDCMLSGTCFDDDHRDSRTFTNTERKFVVKSQQVKSGGANPASSNCITSASTSNTSRCENNSSIAGSSSASSVVASSSSTSTSCNALVNSSILTVTAATSSSNSCANSSSSSSSSNSVKVSNSSAFVINSNNVVNSSSIVSAVSVSSSSSSSKPLVERTTSVSQKQTIQVPSVGGPRRAGVTVQKTVARSLLIKSSKAPAASESSAPAPVKQLVKAAASCALPSLPILPTTVTVPLPTPVKHSCYQPETPVDSEDDPCPLDLPLPSALLNSFLIDNIKPPQGDLWDDVMAAVEEETAAGLIPETPPPSSKASSDSESSDENSLQPPDSFPMMAVVPPPASTSPLHEVAAPAVAASSSSSSSSSDSPASVVNDDHSYHSSAKYGWQRRIDDLGIQTPSDSEEEIDVVSTFERSSNYSSGRSSTCSSPGSSSDSDNQRRSFAAESQELQLAATKLLSEASRAVSKRLRMKLTSSANSKPRGRPAAKRRLSDDLDDDDASTSSSVTRLPTKKAKAHGGRLKKPRFNEEYGDRRRMHNNMERMRRVDLRNSFEDLRGLVPSLMNKERAPKVLILQDAANYCTELKIQSKQLSTEVMALKKEQERLRATVSGLRRSLAAYR